MTSSMYTGSRENRLYKYDIGQTISEHQGIHLQKATSKSEGIDVAIRTIDKEEEKFGYTFENCMFVFHRLGSPFLINVTDSFEDEKHYWIISEWSDKPNLREYVNNLRKGTDQLKEGQIWDIVVAVSTSLYFLHMNGIVHRHFTLNNIFMQSQAHARISDFNLYRYFENPQDFGEDFIDVAAPEILQECPIYTPKSDLWSLGCVIYEIIMGRPPFKGETLDALRKAIKDEDPLPLPRYISPELSSLVYSLLNKDPVERPSIEQIMQITKARQRLNTSVPLLFPGMPELLKEQKQLIVRLEFERREQARLTDQHERLKNDPTLKFPMPPYPPAHLRKKKAEAKKDEKKGEPRTEDGEGSGEQGTDMSVVKDDGEPTEQANNSEGNAGDEKKDEQPETDQPALSEVVEDEKWATAEDLWEAVRYLMRTQYYLRVKLPCLTPSQTCALSLWKGKNVLLARMDMMPMLGVSEMVVPIIPPEPKIRIEGNRICLKSNTPCFIKFNPLLTEGIWRLDLGFVASGKHRWVGVCEADFEFPEDYEPGEDTHTVGYTGHTGAVWHAGSFYNGNRIYHSCDHVGIEVNMSDSPTIHFLGYDSYQPISFKKCPKQLRFWVNLLEAGSTVEILNLSRPSIQLFRDVDQAVELTYGEKPPPRPVKEARVPKDTPEKKKKVKK
ncbi:putative protein kinase [Blattamonas nauphoetae]|uniref:non-specific serine/threonine protein kinase n=1 Tax=Blattamonas nauphoetae TaxID=2049346 RepID=A0ABQ9Y5K4_9EUKA|nr:putative protein kinase [Blattamonas nauphoetae]